MPDLMTALRDADAAGDVEAARGIAAMIKNAQSAPAVDPANLQDKDKFKNLLLRQAKGEAGLESEISRLQGDLTTQQAQRSTREIPQPTAKQLAQVEQSSKISDIVTGESRMTPEMESLPSIGQAPEFGEFSGEAIKSNIATFTTGDKEELKTIFKKQYGDRVSFTTDSKGNDIVNFPSGAYALNKPGLSIQDIPKFFGDLAAFSPAGRAETVPAAIARSVIGESALEGIDKALGGEYSIQDVVEAGVLGGAFKSVEDAVGYIYRAVRGAPAQEGAQLIQESAEAGIPLTTTDVIPPETFAGRVAQQTGEKIPLAGTGGVREAQQVVRERAVEDFTSQFGDFSFDTIIQSLRNKNSGIVRAAGDRLENFGNQLDTVGEIPINNTRSAINNATEELSRPNVLGGQAALDDLNQLVETISNAPQTYTTLKENRTAFRELVDSLDPTARSQLTSRAKSLLRRVENGMTQDMRRFAQDNLNANDFRRLENANQIYAREAERLTKTRLKNVLDKGDFTPENVKQLLFSQKPSEMRSLFRNLTTEGRENARAAIINKIVVDLSKRANGLTPNSFATELRKYNPQISAFFKNQDRRALEGLRRGLEASRRAQDASVTTPTGQSLIGGLTGFAAFTDLGATLGLGGTAGGLARLYESAPVRNALLRLAGTRRGSTAFEQALREANEVLTVAAQTVRGGLQDKEDSQEWLIEAF